MGWTFQHRDKGISNKDFFSQLFDYKREDGSYGKVLECHATTGETYLAYERGTPDGEVRIHALMCLTKWVPKDHYNFGYKDMDENCGPYYCNCPKKILDMLSPTTSEYALKWREECRKKLEKPKVTVGTVVKFTTPLSFGSHGAASTFRCLDKRKGHYDAPELRMAVKLRKDTFDRREWEVVA